MTNRFHLSDTSRNRLQLSEALAVLLEEFGLQAGLDPLLSLPL